MAVFHPGFHPRARLDSYIEGVLPPVVHQRIAAHLARCDECRREVEQRERILQAASSLSQSRADSADLGTSTTQDREASASWRIAAGLSAFGLLSLGAISIAWIAGDPATMSDPDRAEAFLMPTSSPASSAVVSPSTGGSGPDSGANTGTGAPRETLTNPDAAPVGSSSGDSGSSSAITKGGAGAAASGGTATGGAEETTLAGVVELTPSMVTDLRQLGWNVPTLHGLGMRSQSTGWHLGERAGEVVVSLHNDESALVLHECRSLADEADQTGEAAKTPDCPLGQDEAAVGETRELPVGVEMTIQEHDDGSWTASTQTAHATYHVHSDLPAESAARIMTVVVVSERSRVQAGTAPESATDRLARGFERLLPWTGGPEAAAR
ncbi:anti-sigma factor family protein [Citricoccus sp. GCM10030269]|uniref:anti-sigma factor family protein n=1 Tax=Citricoccus sp. GCM10030269 TaxID=3273388 RepID=UPI0036076348